MKRLLSFLLTLSFVLSAAILPASAATLTESDAPVVPEIAVNAYSAILMDMDSGEILFDYDADEQNYPASTTKIMTAYLCCKYGNPKDNVTVSSSAFSNISALASTGGLEVGEKMTVHRLLQALLVVSASEAANVVGEYISGSHEEFVNLMNEEAQALGCTGTHFANCHGLPNDDHYTTAHDLARIARAAMEYEEIRDIVGSAVTTMEATNMSPAKTITSTNGILPGSSYPQYDYEYAIGIKTGHTYPAGYCLISAADNNGRRLLCVIMGCGSRESSFAQTIDLYEWGYENYEAILYGREPAEPEASQEPPEEDSTVEDSVLEESMLEDSTVELQAPVETVAPAEPLVPSMVPAADPVLSQPEATEEAPEKDSLLTTIRELSPLTILFVLLALVALIGGIALLASARRKGKRQNPGKKKADKARKTKKAKQSKQRKQAKKAPPVYQEEYEDDLYYEDEYFDEEYEDEYLDEDQEYEDDEYYDDEYYDGDDEYYDEGEDEYFDDDE